MTDKEILELFVKAAERQEQTLTSEWGGWGHSIYCNNSSGKGTSCNCGVTNMLHALRIYRANNNVQQPQNEEISPEEIAHRTVIKEKIRKRFPR